MNDHTRNESFDDVIFVYNNSRNRQHIIIIIFLIISFFFSPLCIYKKDQIGNPLVYHLSSDEPWRATVAISDATTMLRLGHNVTLLLSIEGVQIGVKHPIITWDLIC